MNITKQELLEAYLKSVDNILDICDWKTHFTGEEICGIVYSILTKNDIKLSISVEQLYVFYSTLIEKRTINRESYQSTISSIIDIIWEILEAIEKDDANSITP